MLVGNRQIDKNYIFEFIFNDQARNRLLFTEIWQAEEICSMAIFYSDFLLLVIQDRTLPSIKLLELCNNIHAGYIFRCKSIKIL